MTKARNISNLSAINRWSKVLTTTSTTISGTDNFSATLSYVAGFEQVYFNGVFLTRGTDYTATNGTTVTLTNAPAVGDQVEVLSALPFTPDNTYTQAQANAAFYQAAVTPVAGKNKLLNGDFSIAQRGTSVAFSGTVLYTLDRWSVSGFGSGQPFTTSQQTASPPTSTRQYLQIVGNSTSATNIYLSQSLETTDVVKLQGKTMTVSFQYKMPTNFTATWAVAAAWGTATDTSLRDVGSGTQISNQALTNQTSWTPASYTFTVPATATQLSIMFITYNNVVNNATFQIANVQLEIGSVATAFTTATGTIQGELAACQRYYWRNTAITSTEIASAIGRSATLSDCVIYFPVQMRSNPSSVEFGGTFALTDPAVAAYNCTTLTFVHASTLTAFIRPTTASGLTQGKSYTLNLPANGYLGFGAEL